MNTPATLAHLTDKDPATGEYQIPTHHLLRRLLLRDGGLRRSHPARHDLSRALGLHLAARPADLRARRPGRRDPPAGGRARSRRAPVPGRADRSRRAAGAAGLRQGGRRAELSRRLCRLHRQPRAHARHRPAGRLARRRRRRATAAARPTRDQLERYIANGCFRMHQLAPEPALLQARQPRLSRLGARHGLHRRTPTPIVFQLYCEPLQKIPPRRARATAPVQPPEQHRARIETYFDPLPFWYPPFEGAALDERELPAARHHAAADARCITPGARRTPGCARSTAQNRLYMQPRRARRRSASPTATGSGSRAASAASRAQVQLMDGVNADTVWTWNAIGKRAGAWALAPDAPEADARLPAQPPDRRAAARARRRLPLLQHRSRHRPGRLVRPARAHREGRGRRGGARPRRASSRFMAPPGVGARLSAPRASGASGARP